MEVGYLKLHKSLLYCSVVMSFNPPDLHIIYALLCISLNKISLKNFQNTQLIIKYSILILQFIFKMQKQKQIDHKDYNVLCKYINKYYITLR